MRNLVAIVFAAALITGAGWIGLSWWTATAKSYEECMLAEMKAQQQNMYSMVDRLCSRRWKREVSVVFDAIQHSWSREGNIATVEATSAEYDITRARVRFAPKVCKEVVLTEWSDYEWIKFIGEKAYAAPDSKYLAAAGKGNTCMQIIDIFGTYK